MKNRKGVLNRMARQIIRKNEYLSLATTSSKGLPWICTLAYTFDPDWNLYFVSIPQSKHGKQLAECDNIACTIFDSRQDWGHGVGLQIEARCKIINRREFKNVSKWYFYRKYPYGTVEPEIKQYFKKSLEDNNSLYKFYKITPRTIWMNNPYSKQDERVKIDLKITLN